VPAASLLELENFPLRIGRPSTFSRPRTWWGTIPRNESNVWFSIMSTTTCSIWGIDSVPSLRLGNGRLFGWRSFAPVAIGWAQAGTPPARVARVAASAVPPAALRAVRRVTAC